ncbi:JAB domain-containing protein [Lysinibacillus sp. FSL W7-1291]|uniref:JAB domain-containing protein n=1 Tax=Lysinibacillus sp. FSL W7-1291 TaxID=2954544 RepID=UPI00315A52DC
MQPSKRVDIVSVKLVKEANILYKNGRIRSPRDCYELFKEFLGEVDREYFVVMCLDVKNQPTNISVVHIGSLNASIVHPREVLKTAILSNAASIICCHPHPSGDPTPSQEDIEVTNRLVEASLIVGVEMLDHIVLGDDSYVSMKESGYFEKE